MNAQGVKRKLSAILSADVEGYSRLMAGDEVATVRTLTAYREVMTSLIQQHRGRVVDSPGDNLLAEFSSVVDAVQCAVAVQKEFQARNAGLPQERRMEFRIGINLGDVIEEGDRIYGDGVNIAARLEALADPGGICISKTAFDQIETKLPLGYEYLGDQTVKNIPKPVGAYRVLMEPRVTVAEEVGKEKAVPLWRRKSIFAGTIAVIVAAIAVTIWNFYFRPPPIEPASVEKMAFPLPDKASIVVLPFVNMSGDPEQDYFSDGLSEEIIAALSKVHNIFVIARHSAFSYKGKPVKVKQVAEHLGVRYVLEGSVRKAGDRLRITGQLIDALAGHHLWAESYDRELQDIFSLQDEITKKIIIALQVELTEGEQARVYVGQGTDNLEAYLKLLQSRAYFVDFKTDLAKETAKEVIALDPKWPQGYAYLALWHLMDVWFHLTRSPKQSLQRAEELAKKAIELDTTLAAPHATLGQIYLLKRQYDDALAEGELAVELSPSSADNIAWLAMTLRSVGRPEEAIQHSQKAVRLSPLATRKALLELGLAYFFAKQYENATNELKKVINRRPKFMPALLGLAAASSMLGEEDEAHAAVEKILQLHPKFSLDRFAKALPYKNQADKDHLIDALRKAGLK